MAAAQGKLMVGQYTEDQVEANAEVKVDAKVAPMARVEEVWAKCDS